MKNDFGYKAGKATKALDLDGYYVWDCSVIESVENAVKNPFEVT